MAAALAAEADVICTNNLAHFPEPVMSDLGVEVMTPDALLCRYSLMPNDRSAVEKMIW